jgi:hypothetical protein
MERCFSWIDEAARSNDGLFKPLLDLTNGLVDHFDGWIDVFHGSTKRRDRTMVYLKPLLDLTNGSMEF